MVYKILNNHVILPPTSLPRTNMKTLKRKCTEPHVGFQNQLLERLARMNNVSKTFFYSASKIWNARVSPSQAVAPSVEAFKSYFSKPI